MGKKHKHEEHENHERWLVSYADFITLLFATFTALYAIASADAAKATKLPEISEAITQGFKEQSMLNGIKSVIQGMSPPSMDSNPLASSKGAGKGIIGKYELLIPPHGQKNTDKSKNRKKTLAQLKESLERINQALKVRRNAQQSLSQNQDKGKGRKTSTHAGHTESIPRDIEVITTANGLKIRLDSSLLFEPGSAAIRPEFEDVLKVVSDKLGEFETGLQIQVEGHTDSQPMFSAIYPSNWELSTARASAVVRYFLNREKAFIPQQFSVTGFAETRPVAENETEAGRSKNRRIDLVLTQVEQKTSVAPDESTPSLAPDKGKTVKLEPKSVKAVWVKPAETAKTETKATTSGFKIRYGHVTPLKPKSSANLTLPQQRPETEAKTEAPPIPQASVEDSPKPL
jgi:chemotaxis protein MotB